MHDNTWERVTFLVNLMVGKLDKFDGPMFGGEMKLYKWPGRGGSYICDVNCLIYFLGVAYIQGGGGWYRGSINGILRYKEEWWFEQSLS